MKQGMQMLETMLSSLQGALGAQSAPKAEPETPPKEDLPPKPAKSPAPDLLEYVIGVLKSQLDEDDGAPLTSPPAKPDSRCHSSKFRARIAENPAHAKTRF